MVACKPRKSILSLYLRPLCIINERCYPLLLLRIQCPFFVYAVNLQNQKDSIRDGSRCFSSFLGLKGGLKDQAKNFLEKAKANPDWAENNLIHFISNSNERAERGEISLSTIPNYYRATKLLCEMNKITLVWKKIARGMARVRKAANDRASTLEEIQCLIKYPDRRIKPIVYTNTKQVALESSWWQEMKVIQVIYIRSNRSREAEANTAGFPIH